MPALIADLGDPQGPEPLPGGRWRGRAQSTVARRRRVVGLFGEALQRGLPPGTQCRNAKCTLERVPRMAGQVEQRIDLGDRHLFRPRADLDDLLAGFDFPFADDPAVETRPPMGDEQCRHPGLPDPNPRAVTGDSRLSDLEYRLADLVAITDADLVVGQAVHRQVLAEVSRPQVVPVEFLGPVPVRVELIDQDRAVLPAVPTQIPLAVAVDVEPAHHARAVHRLLPQTAVDRPVVPLDVLGQPNVHGRQRRHGGALLHRNRRSREVDHLKSISSYPTPGARSAGWFS